jgi:hypothetical protein
VTQQKERNFVANRKSEPLYAHGRLGALEAQRSYDDLNFKICRAVIKPEKRFVAHRPRPLKQGAMD